MRFRLWVVMVMVLLTVAACGGEDPTPASGGNTGTGGESAATTIPSGPATATNEVEALPQGTSTPVIEGSGGGATSTPVIEGGGGGATSTPVIEGSGGTRATPTTDTSDMPLGNN
jgi:hypothetical protein